MRQARVVFEERNVQYGIDPWRFLGRRVVPICRCILQRPRGILHRWTVRPAAIVGAVSPAAGWRVGLLGRRVIARAAARQRAATSRGTRVAYNVEL